MGKKIAALVQARTNSTRLPNKVFEDICGKPLIYHVFNRLKKSTFLNEFILCTTNNLSDDSLVNWSICNNITFFRGEESNVLNRYYSAAKQFNVDIIVRITADDPLKDPKLIDEAILEFINNDFELVTNNFPPSFPEGLDVEVLDIKTLEFLNKADLNNDQKEHVTKFIYDNHYDFKIKNIKSKVNFSNYRWTIDTIQDLNFMRKVYSLFDKKIDTATYIDIISFLKNKNHLLEINNKVTRSERYR